MKTVNLATMKRQNKQTSSSVGCEVVGRGVVLRKGGMAVWRGVVVMRKEEGRINREH